MEFDEFSRGVIGCAIEMHRNLGPGLLALPVRYKDILLDCGYRIDLLVRGELIVEIKSVEALLPIHQAQILTYMRLANVPIGLLINFNVTRLQTGIKRFVL
jgi:GxxExxY protein